MTSGRPIPIVGAGPAGIAAALALRDAGLRPLVFDAADEVAASWRTRYDRLRLNTCRWLSHLPGRRFPRGTPMFPSRDEFVAHLEVHAREPGIELRLGTRVQRIAREDGGWRAETSAGVVSSDHLIVATGHEGVPVVPAWPGRETFGPPVLHSSEYRNPDRFAGQTVLVVGPGCSGMEIAYDLATGGARRVLLAVRTPPNIMLRSGPGGFPGDVIGVALLRAPVRFADAFSNFGRRMDLGDLTAYGLPVPEEGLFARFHRLGTVPSIVDPEVIDAIKDGSISVVAGVESLEGAAVRLADGARLEPDAVIAATGYRTALDDLVGHLDVLDGRGLPRAQGREAAAPGLRFIGYTSRPGALGYMGKQARQAARAIARERG